MFGTHTHCSLLAIRYRDDYVAAALPMLPAVAPAVVVARQILAYSYVMVAVSLLLWPVAGMGWLYVTAAAALGGAFLLEAHALLRRARISEALTVLAPMRLFHGSNAYLALLFVAVAIDPLLR